MNPLHRNPKANEQLALVAPHIKLILISLDGVFSSGHILFSEEKEYQSLHIKDIIGIRMLLAAEFEIAITAQRVSKTLEKRIAQLGIRHLFTNTLDKAQILEDLLKRLSLTAEQSAVLAGDIYDLPLMDKVALAACVADAAPVIRERAHWQSRENGGCGAVREFAELLLIQQNLLHDTIQKLTTNAQIRY